MHGNFDDILDQMLRGLLKAWFWIAAILAGMVGKVGEMLQSDKYLTKKQIIGKLMVTFTIGCLSVLFFAWKCPASGGISITGAMGVMLSTWFSSPLSRVLAENYVSILRMLARKGNNTSREDEDIN